MEPPPLWIDLSRKKTRKVKDGKDKLKKKSFFKYFLAQNSEKTQQGVYYLSCVMWPPHWAPPWPHSLVLLPAPLPLTPCILPSWQMSKYSEWGEIANNRIKVAKHKQLHEMEPLCFIWRWHTLFSRSQMITRWCMCMASAFWEETHFYKLEQNLRIKKGWVDNTTPLTSDKEVQCT